MTVALYLFILIQLALNAALLTVQLTAHRRQSCHDVSRVRTYWTISAFSTLGSFFLLLRNEQNISDINSNENVRRQLCICD